MLWSQQITLLGYGYPLHWADDWVHIPWCICTPPYGGKDLVMRSLHRPTLLQGKTLGYWRVCLHIAMSGQGWNELIEKGKINKTHWHFIVNICFVSYRYQQRVLLMRLANGMDYDFIYTVQYVKQMFSYGKNMTQKNQNTEIYLSLYI